MGNNPAFALVLVVIGAIILISGVLGTTGAMLSGLLYGALPNSNTGKGVVTDVYGNPIPST
ncbi:exported hypothetical protein [Candidatus Desulfosporosinus infrequens]|uniref:Uncharacterized protein n=1 Tax=Candidatus Desulfosporosinus infrequens TaxID=2043169 RepID=A0A2U3LKV5_9FIRM|nr:exported hypothetical protein [Candidatus Desulfosporosinus infrequens]